MTPAHRIALAVSALAFGLAATPAARAAESMMGSSMHKHMKKHKGSMMKGDAMKKGDAMDKGDAMEKTDAPAQ